MTIGQSCIVYTSLQGFFSADLPDDEVSVIDLRVQRHRQAGRITPGEILEHLWKSFNIESKDDGRGTHAHEDKERDIHTV